MEDVRSNRKLSRREEQRNESEKVGMENERKRLSCWTERRKITMVG